MLIVTNAARTKLNELLHKARPQGSNLVLRIALLPEDENKLGIVFDSERAQDTIIKNKVGMNLLSLDPEIKSRTDKMILDFKQTPMGSGFIMGPASAETWQAPENP